MGTMGKPSSKLLHSDSTINHYCCTRLSLAAAMTLSEMTSATSCLELFVAQAMLRCRCSCMDGTSRCNLHLTTLSFCTLLLLVGGWCVCWLQLMLSMVLTIVSG